MIAANVTIAFPLSVDRLLGPGLRRTASAENSVLVVCPVSLKQRVPASLRPALGRARREAGRVRREAMRRSRHIANRRLIGADYAAVHDGRTLNVFVGRASAESLLAVVDSHGRVAAGGAPGNECGDGRSWTLDLGSLDDGEYALALDHPTDRRMRIDIAEPSTDVSDDPGVDGPATFGASPCVELRTGRSGLTVVKSTQRAQPYVRSMLRHNDGRLDLVLEGVEDAASLVGIERASSDERTLADVARATAVIDVNRLPAQVDSEQIWDVFVVEGEGRRRLRMTARDLSRPDRTLSVPAWFDEREGLSVRCKAYCAVDAGLSMRVTNETPGASS